MHASVVRGIIMRLRQPHTVRVHVSERMKRRPLHVQRCVVDAHATTGYHASCCQRYTLEYMVLRVPDANNNYSLRPEEISCFFHSTRWENDRRCRCFHYDERKTRGKVFTGQGAIFPP